MFCSKCGKEIKDETVKFCPACGQAVGTKSENKDTSQPEREGISNKKIWKIVLLLVGIVGIFVGFYLSNHAANLYGLDHSIGDQWWFEHGGTTAIVAWVGGGIAFIIGCIL